VRKKNKGKRVGPRSEKKKKRKERRRGRYRFWTFSEGGGKREGKQEYLSHYPLPARQERKGEGRKRGEKGGAIMYPQVIKRTK